MNGAPSEVTVNSRPFCFIVVVWGEQYCRRLADFCLSSLLAPNNLPCLDAAAGHRLLIATTRADWQRLEHAPAIERLRRYVTPTLIEIELPSAPGYGGVLQHQTRCLKQLFDAAYAYRGYGCLLLPDVIFSDGLVTSMQRSVRNGDHLLLLTAMRQTEEDVLAELSARGLMSKEREPVLSAEPLTIPPRTMADLAVRHLHPESMVYAEGQRRQQARPPFRFWRLGNGRGLVLRTFSGLPILMDFAAVPADHTACLEQSNYESAYLASNFPDSSSIRVITDSDECCILSLTPAAVDRTRDWWVFRRVGARLVPRLALLADLRNSMVAYVRTHHDEVRRALFQRSVRWHADNVDDAWLREEAEIDRMITRAAGDYYDNPSHFPARVRRNPRYWMVDLFAIAQHLLRYVYALQIVLAALTGNAEERAILRQKLSAIGRRLLRTGRQ